MFKYAAEHNRIDTLADYRMDIGPDTSKVTNPARVAARITVAAAEAELAAANALPQLLARPDTPQQKNAAMANVHRRIDKAAAALNDAVAALRPVPAKVAATQLDPNAKRASSHLARRGPANGPAAARVQCRSVAG